MRFILGILAILGATFFHWIGETSENPWKIKSNKWYKCLMGIPPAILLGFVYGHLLLGLLCILTYFIALQFGYGQNNWLTKLVGNKGALGICGFLMGIASIPILGLLGILQGIISCATFLLIDKYKEKIKEPYVAYLRGVLGTICLL